MGEVTREWRKLHNEELNDLYSSPNIVRVMESRRVIGAGYVARTGRGEAYIRFRRGKLTRPFGRRWHILKIIRCIFRKWDVWFWTGSCWLRIGTGGGHL